MSIDVHFQQLHNTLTKYLWIKLFADGYPSHKSCKSLVLQKFKRIRYIRHGLPLKKSVQRWRRHCLMCRNAFPKSAVKLSHARRLARNTEDTHHKCRLLDRFSAQTMVSSGYEDKQPPRNTSVVALRTHCHRRCCTEELPCATKVWPAMWSVTTSLLIPPDDAFKGRLLASLKKEAGAWLTAPPVSSLGLGLFYCVIG